MASSGQKGAGPSAAKPASGLTPSSAPNNAFGTGAGNEATGFDSPPVTSIGLSNKQVELPDEQRPLRKPDGTPRHKPDVSGKRGEGG